MTLRPSTTPWLGIPVRVLLVTFIGTLTVFAVSLLLGIIGTVVASSLRHVNPNMTSAYRNIALPAGVAAGIIIFVIAVTLEVRYYRQSKTLAGIERVS
jgi:hypothetical protein